jgi:hypothetical protein
MEEEFLINILRITGEIIKGYTILFDKSRRDHME